MEVIGWGGDVHDSPVGSLCLPLAANDLGETILIIVAHLPSEAAECKKCVLARAQRGARRARVKRRAGTSGAPAMGTCKNRSSLAEECSGPWPS
eukprot:scaffold24272_cov27-Tisochrysis_lutea.AAC.4